MAGKKEIKEENNFFPILEKYDMSTLKIEDKGLERYINLETKDFFLGGNYANKQYGKSKIRYNRSKI